MKLARADPEPAAAAGAQYLWFFNLFQAEQSSEEGTRLWLASWGCGELNMIQIRQLHGPIMGPPPAYRFDRVDSFASGMIILRLESAF